MLEPRTVIEGFEIQELLRAGPRGEVYEAVQGSLLRPVALRLISRELSEDPDFVARFWRQEWPEHAHIVSVYEAGECKHGLFVAMQLIRGETLAELLERDALEEGVALSVLTQVAGALDSVHADGLAHGWVRPQAVLIERSGRPWLSDFGLAPGAASPAADRKDFAALVRTCLGRRSVPRGEWQTASACIEAAAARRKSAAAKGERSARGLRRLLSRR